MAVDQRSLPAFLSSDADFQTWYLGIHAQLTACGLVQTSDTGQMGATVAKPTVVTTAAGFRMYRFSDTLQSTFPVLLKVEFGVAGAVDRPSLWLTVGTASNGAGTLTGVQVSTRRQSLASLSMASGATLQSYCSGDGGRVMLFTNANPSSSSYGIGLMVDRLRDGSGAAQGDGVSIINSGSGATSWNQQFIEQGQSVNVAGSPFAPSLTNSNVRSSVGTNVALAPVFGTGGGKLLWTPHLSGHTNDFTGISTITVTHLGASRTFLVLDTAADSFGGGTNQIPIPIYE